MDDYYFTATKSENSQEMTIYIPPVPKARPRMTRDGRVYTPSTTTRYERQIADAWRKEYKSCHTGPLKIEIDFYEQIPKSMSKENRMQAMYMTLRPAKRPDIDNLVKAVLDALNEVAYFDDRQIVEIKAEKYYGDPPRVSIRIEEIDNGK